MRHFSVKSIVASSVILATIVSVSPANAVVYDISGIPEKNTGDAITASEVNLIVDMLRNIRKDDRDDLDVSNDRIGIGLAGTPGYMLDVNGTVNAAAFRGDGSQLTNLPNPGAWQITANDIYYNAGKVAIGINSSPTYELEVHDASDSDIQIVAGGSGNDASLRLRNDTQEWIIRNNGGSGDNFQISNITSGNVVMDVDSSSNNVTISNELTVNDDITSTGIIYATEFFDTATGAPVGSGGLWEEGAENDEIYYDADNVGIGIQNPAFPLQVGGDAKFDDSMAVGAGASFNTDRLAYFDRNFSTDASNFLLMAQGTSSGATTGEKTFRGAYIDVESNQTESSGNAYTEGIYTRARTSGNATFNSIRGINATAFNDSAAGSGIGSVVGVRGEAYNESTVGAVGSVYGSLATARGRSVLPAGDVTNLYGAYSQAAAYESQVDNAYGAYNYARTINGDTGDIDTAYGSYNRVNVDSASGGDITTGFGVYSLLDGRTSSTEFTTATGVYADVNNAVTAYGGRFYADDPAANLNYGIVVGASGATNNYGIYGTDGDWVLDADGDGALGGTGSDLIIGEGADLRLYHNGTNSFIDNRTGNLSILNSGSGNVGIGTSNVVLPLTVVGNGFTYGVGGVNFDAVAMFTNSDNGSGVVLGGETSGGDAFIVSNTDGSDLILANNFVGVGAAEAMRIAANGNVGIGDNTPDGTLKLDVEGQIGATEFCDENGANCVAAADLGAGLWTANGTNAFYNIGNVGIGTNTPSEKLHIADAGSAVLRIEADTDNLTETDNARIEMSQDGGLISGRFGFDAANNYEVVNEYDSNINFGTDNIIRMSIGGDGEVGVGTSTPTEEFYVTKTQTDPTTLVIQNSSTGAGANLRSGLALSANEAQLDLMLYGVGATGSLSGITKSDAAFLRTATSAGVSSLNIGNGASAPINFITNDVNRVTIADDGKMGIGTDNPSNSLTIVNAIDDQGFSLNTPNGRVYQSYASGQNRLVIGEKNIGAGSAGLYLNGKDGDISGADYAALVHSGTTGDLTLTTTDNSGTWTNADIVLAPAGSVGIGIGTISAGLKLEVAGRVGAAEYCDEAGLNCTAAGALGSGYWSKTGDDVWYSPGVTGEVGIGISNPSEELTVRRTQTTPTTIAVQNSSAGTGTTVRAGLALQSDGNTVDLMTYGTGATGSIGGQNRADSTFLRTSSSNPVDTLNVGTGGTQDLNLFTNDTTRVTVDGSTGDVGIGTTTPQKSLHVVGPDGAVPSFPTAGATDDVLVLENNGSANIGIVSSSTGNSSLKFFDNAATSFRGMVLYDHVNDRLELASNGVENLFLDSAGEVGVGTATPSEELQVFKNQANPTTIVAGNTSTNTNTNTRAGFTAASSAAQVDIVAYGQNATGTSGGVNRADAVVMRTGTTLAPSSLNVGTGGAQDFNLFTSDATRMTIQAGGDVGIGDTTPDGTLRLDVEGRVGATEYCDENGANCTAAAALGSGYWSKTGDDVWYNPGATGEVGIGLSNPSEELVVSRNQAAPTTVAALNSSTSNNTNTRAGFTAQSNAAAMDMMVYSSAATGSIGGVTKADAAFVRTSSGSPVSSMNIGTGAANELNLFTNDTTRLTVTETGSVGIGATSPGAKLDIAAPAGSYLLDLTNETEAPFALRTYNSGSAINTKVFNTSLYYNTIENAGVNFYRGGSTSGGWLTFSTNNGTERMIIDNTGDVGIGDTTPDGTLKLDVEGRVGATEYCDQNGANCTLASELGSGYWSKTGDDVWYNPGATGEVGIGLSNPTEELVVNRSANDAPTTIAVQNSNAGTGTNTRAGFTAASNAAQIDIMAYGSAATGTIGGVNKADGAFVRTGSTLAPSSLNVGTGAANDVNIFTNDTTRLTVDGSTGNVGIGTTDPDSLLHIEAAVGGADVRDQLRIKTTRGDFTTPAGSAIVFENRDGNNALNEARIKVLTENNNALGFNDEGGSSFVFSTSRSGTEADQMIIRGDGAVGMGTVQPTEELHVRTDQANPTTIAVQNTNTSNNTNTRAGFTAASSAAQLDIVAYGQNAAGTQAGITKADAAFIRTGTTLDASSLNIGTGSNDPLNLFTNDVARMTFLGNGNVGIGETNPLANLQITGPGAITTLRVSNSVAGNSIFRSWNDGGTAKTIIGSGQNDNIITFQNQNGNVGLGTQSPEQELHINGTDANFQITDSDTGADFMVLTNSSVGGAIISADQNNEVANSYLSFRVDGGTNKMRIDADGQVGIGEDTPDGTLLLDVEGQIGATEFCNEDGANCVDQADLGTGKWLDGLSANEIYYNAADVGIGTNAPASRLHVVDAGAEPLILERTNSSDVALRFMNSANSMYAGISNSEEFGISTSANIDAALLTVERNGEIGMGTANPAEELQVFRDANNEPTTIAVGNISTGTGTNTRAGFTAASNAAQVDIVAYGQNATGTSGGVNRADAVVIRTGATLAPSSLNVGTGAAQDLNLFTNDTTRLTVDGTTGNVGINDTNPGEALEVGGNINATGTAYFGDGKEIIRYSDSWLRLNPANNFGTGIYAGSGVLRTDGEFQISNNGSRFVVETSGEVGIGTQNPTAPLDISSAQPNILFADTDTGADGGILANSGVGGLQIAADRNSEVVGSYIDLNVDGTTVLRATEGGDVGIGDDTPDLTLKLDVEGQIGATEYCDANGANCTTAGSLGGKWLDGVGANEIYYSAGSVGIGIANPNDEFHVYHPTQNTVATFESGDGSAAIALADTAGSARLQTSGVGELWFYSGGTASTSGDAANFTMAIEGNGEVGIGTANPAEELQVFRDANNEPTTIAVGNISTGTGTNTRAGFTAASNAAQVDIVAYGQNATGTSGGVNRADAVVMRTGATLAPSSLNIGTGAAQDLNLFTNDTTRLTVDGTTGNVGIGTVSPTDKLEVIGAVRSQLSVSGNDTGIILTNDGSQRPKVGFRVSDDSERFKIHLESINTVNERLGFTKSSGGSAEVLSIVSTGRIGMGTITPSEELQVFKSQAGPTTIVAGNTSTSTNTNTRAGFTAASNSAQLDITAYGSAATGTQATITKADAVFIRTGSTLDASALSIGTGSASDVNIFTTDIPRMTVASDGDVGIGITNPAAGVKLDVAGTVMAASFVQASDERLKNNIKKITDPLAVLGIRGVTFDWNDSGKGDYGFIAQELETIYPDLVFTNPETDMKAVSYSGMNAILLEAIKAQQTQIETLSTRLSVLESVSK
jgi:hypothetical protein